ncbi:hypothetical protein OsJ_32890 [Oryza sativa Japonica Group]|uniref:Proteasome component Ecm29 N-terminal domain-containing protein n=1 Tax=Oryza sativa subsp. japonica TaxID=39947 RepID=B9G9B1_ORYSJ|nr:hypothetical protein OsJ_32890 [Oryza sativa Japonica Group]
MAETSSAAAAAQTDAEREEALDRMLTRLALAEDARLAPLLARVLPYAITSLASATASVRKLVMEILSHINKRVKHRPEISLPMLDLWRIYTESTSSTIVRNFCIVYIEMAFERLLSEDKGSIAPDLLINISNVTEQHQGIILRLVVKLGILNVIEAMQLAPEIVYPLYLAAASDRYFFGIMFTIR